MPSFISDYVQKGLNYPSLSKTHTREIAMSPFLFVIFSLIVLLSCAGLVAYIQGVQYFKETERQAEENKRRRQEALDAAMQTQQSQRHT